MYRQGDGNILKTIFVVLLAGGFLLSGALNIIKQIKTTNSLDEIVRFINLVKTEVHYRTADYEFLYLKGKEQNYKYLSFSDGEIFVNNGFNFKLAEEFNSFIEKIGTTDEDGLINLCNEYKERFENYLVNRKAKEKEKLQVNTALSAFGALTVLIFFL